MQTIKEQIENMDSATVMAAYEQAGSMLGTLNLLGIDAHSQHTRLVLKAKLAQIDPTYHQKFSGRNRYTVDEIRAAVKSAMCMSDVLRNLGLSTHGTNSTTIYTIMEKHSISTAHFDVAGSMQRNKHRWIRDDIFTEHSPIPRSTVNAQVRRYAVLGEEVCSECGVGTVYHNKPLRLTVDHINGINDDNRVENLRWLCHNCHSQTDDFQGKGKIQKR